MEADTLELGRARKQEETFSRSLPLSLTFTCFLSLSLFLSLIHFHLLSFSRSLSLSSLLFSLSHSFTLFCSLSFSHSFTLFRSLSLSFPALSISFTLPLCIHCGSFVKAPNLPFKHHFKFNNIKKNHLHKISPIAGQTLLAILILIYNLYS